MSVSIQSPPLRATDRLARNHQEWTEYSGLLRNPDNIPISTYERMFDTDETVGAGIDFLSLAIVSGLGKYENKNKRARLFIESLWHPTDGARISLEQIIEEMCSAFWAGFSVAENVYKYDGSRITLDTVVYLKPSTVDFTIDRDPNSRDFGEVVNVRQNLSIGAQAPIIPIQKCLHYAHGSRNGNPYGRSRLKRAWQNWFPKVTLLQEWGRGLQRYGTPTAVGRTGDPNRQVKDQNGDLTTEGALMQAVLDSMSNGTSLVIQLEQLLEFLEPKVAFGADFKMHEDQRNKLILRALLNPALLHEPTEIGSLALGSKHFEMFLRAVRRAAADFRRVILRQLYGPLLRWNFGPKVPIGQFVCQEMTEEDLKLWAEILFSLTTAGYLSPRLQGDMDFARDKMGLPHQDVSQMPQDEPQVAPEEDTPAGDHGQPGKAPDGQEGGNLPTQRPMPKTPTTPQGRPANKAALRAELRRTELRAEQLRRELRKAS